MKWVLKRSKTQIAAQTIHLLDMKRGKKTKTTDSTFNSICIHHCINFCGGKMYTYQLNYLWIVNEDRFNHEFSLSPNRTSRTKWNYYYFYCNWFIFATHKLRIHLSKSSLLYSEMVVHEMVQHRLANGEETNQRREWKDARRRRWREKKWAKLRILRKQTLFAFIFIIVKYTGIQVP